VPITITEVVAIDVRFATSDSLDGSDAMNDRPDYSAACVIGRYVVPTAPGYSITMHPESLARFAFPDGPDWTSRRLVGQA
jgi:hypothetical protein